MLTLNNNNNSGKLEKYGFENSSENSMKNVGNGAANGGGVLPSFHDILWCPDVDGDVMDSSGMGGAMVRSFHLASIFIVNI